jgi:hypothetical protein
MAEPSASNQNPFGIEARFASLVSPVQPGSHMVLAGVMDQDTGTATARLLIAAATVDQEIRRALDTGNVIFLS